MLPTNLTFKLTVFFIISLIILPACGSQPTVPGETSQQTEAQDTPAPTTLTLMSHDSFNVSESLLAEFEAEHNVKVELLPSGDTGAALNQAILAKDAPLADVFFGVDNTFMSRALNSEIFESYDSPRLADIPAEFQLDSENRLLPVDYGDVCLNYDKGWFADQTLDPPANLEDLLEPAYAGLTVVENPATSSPGLAFLLATIVHFGEDGYLDYWQQLAAQDVLVVDGWEAAYYGEFTRYEGSRPVVVSYASSPPAEVYFAEESLKEAPTASVIGDEACFRQIEFVGILVGTENRALAEQLIDFMLSVPFQEGIPLNMFVFPVNPNAELPQVFQEYAQLADNPATMLPEKIEDNRETWINDWTETVLR